ncbi:MAG: hypothetical protein ABI036_13900 [Fibrobacteria bacterium]
MAVDLRAAYLSMGGQGPPPFPPECLEYLMQLILRATFRGKGFRDLRAADLCRIFHAQVEEDFGALAPAALDRFGIVDYGDLGRAVFLLAEQGLLTLKDGESPADYSAAGPIRFGSAQ